MANTKISALPASTTPLAGTEVLPIVQSTTTKQVSVANLTAGRAVATGALTVTGAASVSSTLGVTGAATLSSTLGVTGAATLSSSLGVAGATTLFSVATTSGTIANSPSGSTDIANKAYVDTVAQGLDTKASVVAGTTANITLSGTQTIDGVVLIAGDRVLVKNQTTTANNGLYLCAAGSWTRTTDMDTWAEVPGAYVFVEGGSTLADTGWVCTSDAGGTIGVTAIVWAQFSGAGSGVSSINFGTTGLTPSSVTTGAVTVAGTLAVANGGTGINSFGTGIATFLGTPSSANLAAALTDETGTGVAVFATNPVLVTPNLGTPSAAVLTSATGLPLSTGVTGQLPVANGGTGTATPSIVAGTNVTVTGTWPNQTIASSGGGGGIIYTTVKTANYTAVANDGVQTNTTSGAFTVTLPATPSNGNQVFVVDSFNTWGTNNLTIGRNGSTIEGVAQDLVCDITGVSVQCVYNGTTWDIFAQVGGAGGSVVTGPASSTDNAIARFDLTTGKIIQNSVVTIADTTGDVAGVGSLSTTGVISAVISGGTANPGNAFWFSDNSASAMMYARQNGAGDLFGLSAGATEKFRVTAAGVAEVASGVKFPATQSASADANTLDDYEEGTWSASGITEVNCTGASFSEGRYTKIGNIVHIQGKFTLTITTANTLTYVNMAAPFTPVNIISGSLMDNGSLIAGAGQVHSNGQAYAFFAASASEPAGATTWYINAQYQV